MVGARKCWQTNILFRPHQACMSLAYSAAPCDQDPGYMGNLGPRWMLWEWWWIPAGGSHQLTFFGKVPEGRIGWATPSSSPGWARCRRGGGLLLPLVFWPLWHEQPLSLPVYGSLVLELETSSLVSLLHYSVGLTWRSATSSLPPTPGVAFSVEVEHFLHH